MASTAAPTSNAVSSHGHDAPEQRVGQRIQRARAPMTASLMGRRWGMEQGSQTRVVFL